MINNILTTIHMTMYKLFLYIYLNLYIIINSPKIQIYCIMGLNIHSIVRKIGTKIWWHFALLVELTKLKEFNALKTNYENLCKEMIQKIEVNIKVNNKCTLSQTHIKQTDTYYIRKIVNKLNKQILR